MTAPGAGGESYPDYSSEGTGSETTGHEDSDEDDELFHLCLEQERIYVV
jgi:hypothetical protein